MTRTVDLIWVVTYRMSPDEAQQEITRYTKEAANAFALRISNEGGLAVITEDARSIDSPDDDDHPGKRIIWPEEN